jgi:isopentenyl-diphosphate delta-isomerase
MTDPTNDRKLEHINIIQEDSQTDRKKFFFDAVHLKHRALPELDLAEIDPSITFLGKKLAFPLLISSMTGGDHKLVKKINGNLAIAAEEASVAMGVGSQRVMFTNPEAIESFQIRAYAPTTLLFANLGAVQLNYGFGLDHCRQAIDTVGADAVYFHCNPLQEAVHPEGDTNFKGLARKIGHIAQKLEKPVFLKEVGAGFSPADVKLVLQHGIHYIDVAGSGGTSWSRIEHYRQDEQQNDSGILFQDWGNPTPWILQQLKPFRDRLTLVASGGVRSGIDMVKAIILGASLCGMASPFLKPAMESHQAVIQVIEKLKKEFTIAMFLLGTAKVSELFGNESLISNPDFQIF